MRHVSCFRSRCVALTRPRAARALADEAGPVIAPLRAVSGADEVLASRGDPFVAFLSAKDAPSLLLRCADDAALASRLAGAVVLDAADASERPPGESPAVRTPQPEWAESSAAAAHAWNPAGSGLAAKRLPFPVLLAAPGDGAAALRAAAAHNERRAYDAPPLYHARLDHGMIATGNAAACLEASTCLPLGGYSAFAAAPLPAPPPGAAPPRLLLVTAALDSAALFHERAVGADASLSGLVVMLAAADAMNRLPPLPAAPARRVAFAALAGEPWGHIGTRMLLAQLAGGARPAGVGAAEAGVDLLELSSLGCDVASGAPVQLYAHAAGDAGAPMAAALVAAAGTSGGAVRVAMAWAQAPGLPPSGLRAARRRDAAIGGVVLSDYDASYGSAFFGSRYDDGPPAAASLAAAADVIAAALHALAAGAARPPQPPAGGRAATLRRVEALMVRSGLQKPHSFGVSRVADASHCAGVLDAGAAQ